VSGVALSPRVLRGRRRSELRFTLSEPATVRIVLDRARQGRRFRGRCLAPASAPRGRPRCTRLTPAGALTRKDRPAGPNTIALTRRIRGRTLAAGVYRAAIAATDAAGNRSTAPPIDFTVAQPRNR